MSAVGDNDEIFGGRSAKAVGDRLRLTREVLGFNQKEFATRASIAANTYNMIEKGKNYPSITALWSICDAYQLDPNWVLAGDHGSLKYDLAHSLYQAAKLRPRYQEMRNQ